MDLSIIKEKIYERRKDLDMSQDELAEKAGLGKNGKRSISTWENGKPPKLENLNKLATALRCDPEHLLGFDEHPHVSTPWIAEQVPLDEDVIESLICLKSECDECGESDPITNDNHLKELLVDEVIRCIIEPPDRIDPKRLISTELLELVKDYLHYEAIVYEEMGLSKKSQSEDFRKAKRQMRAIEHEIGLYISKSIVYRLQTYYAKSYGKETTK